MWRRVTIVIHTLYKKSSKAAAKKVFVYVESDEDISFWRNIFHDYETYAVTFEITTPTKKGKRKAIEKGKDILDLTVGEYLIVCVDSDYDYLLPAHSEQSKLVNGNPFIFQTYAYSIENLQCFSNSLHALCVQATKHDKKVIDFNEFLKLFSKITYRLFLWNLYFRKENDHTTFTISQFCDIVKLVDKVDISDYGKEAIAGLKARVDAKSKLLETDHPLVQNEIDKLASELQQNGLNEENTYLFIHGHTLKDNVVLMVLNPVYNFLIKKKEDEISQQNADNKQQLINEMKHYRKQKQDISSVLKSNTEFKNCFLYQKIKSDLDQYIQSFKQSFRAS